MVPPWLSWTPITPAPDGVRQKMSGGWTLTPEITRGMDSKHFEQGWHFGYVGQIWQKGKKLYAWYKNKKLYFLWFLYVFWPILNTFTRIHFFCPKSRFWVIGPKRCKKSEFRWFSATVNRIKITFFCIFYDLYGFLIELFSGPGHRFRVSAIFDQMPRKIFFDVFFKKNYKNIYNYNLTRNFVLLLVSAIYT